MSKKPRIAGWMGVGLVILALTAIVLDDASVDNTQVIQTPELPSISVIKARTQPHTADLLLTGEVKPLWDTPLIAEVEGQIQAVSEHFRAGASLDKGEWLLTLEQGPYRKQLDAALAQLADAELQVQLAQSQLSEARTGLQLSAKKPRSNPLRLHQQRLQLAKAQRNAAHSTVTESRRLLSQTRLTAPYQGWLVQRNVSLGSMVQIGQPVAHLQSSERLTVALHLSEHQWQQLPTQWLGQAVTLNNLNNNQTWQGSLQRLSEFVSADTRQRLLYVKVPPQPGLLAGTYVSVRITGKRYDTLLALPESALTLQQHLWWLDANNRLQKHRPDRVFAGAGKVYVNPPQPGELTVVLYPTQRLQVNQLVQANVVEQDQ